MDQRGQGAGCGGRAEGAERAAQCLCWVRAEHEVLQWRMEWRTGDSNDLGSIVGMEVRKLKRTRRNL